MRAINQSSTKASNKNLITKLIILNQPISRVELAKITGLTKMTVTNIVGELISEGIVKEGSAIKCGSGRHPVGLEIAKGSVQIIGIYLSRKQICAIRADISGNILSEHNIELENENEQTLCQKLILAASKVSDKKVCAICVSAIGPLDSRCGVILNPPNFFGIKNLDLCAVFKEFGLPVYLENDTKTSALAEKYFGKAKKIKNFIYLGIASGIGAGIVENDRLFLGNNGFAGEIGHTTIDENGPVCDCGNKGCLELYLSSPEAYTKEAEKHLASGLVTLINLFDPSCIYLGHDSEKYGKDICESLYENINKRFVSREYKEVKIEFSKFGKNAPLYGAIALFVNKMYN